MTARTTVGLALGMMVVGLWSADAGAEWRKVTAATADVHAKADALSEVVKVLDKGRFVNVIRSEGSWKRINLPVVGWVSGKDITDYRVFKEPRLFEVTASRLNVRADNSTSARVVKVLKKKQAVRVVGKTDNWKRIGSPVDGWVHKKYVRFGLRRYVTASSLNVRRSPSLSAGVKKRLKKGTRVRVIEKKGDWRRIDKPASGWVHSKYISSKKPRTAPSLGGTFYGTAYKYGRAYRIALVRIDGKAVAKKSAGPFLQMREAARRSGVSIYIVSGFRTMAEQQYLWNLYGSPRAARPGYSNHQSGTAFDLNTAGFYGSVYTWLTRNAWRYGFKRTVSFEPWHWEYMR